MIQTDVSQFSSVLYSPQSELVLAFNKDCRPVYFSKSFSELIHLQGIPLSPKTRATIQELQMRTVVYPPSKSANNQEYFLFKRVVEEWFKNRLQAEGYKYVIVNDKDNEQ